MAKLYDLYLGDKFVFQMRAPLAVMVSALKLGDAAMQRIEYETADGCPCDVHKNGFDWFVFPATVALGTKGEPESRRHRK